MTRDLSTRSSSHLKTVAIVGQALVFRVARATVLRDRLKRCRCRRRRRDSKHRPRSHHGDPHKNRRRPWAMNADNDCTERSTTDVPVLIVAQVPPGWCWRSG